MSKTLRAVCSIQTTDAKGVRVDIAPKAVFHVATNEEAEHLIALGAALAVDDTAAADTDDAADEFEDTSDEAETDAPASPSRRGRKAR
ncbi:MAG: hypothetical protein DDT26_00289 [Dehalococcoidia bacterium]|nr:hypothetical protein [Chloroflexota bacterium]